jgi:hypothetical protein
LLKFIKLKKENVSIFLDIKEKGDKIMQDIAKQQKIENVKIASLMRFRLAISDWFSAIAIVIVSYLLLSEYLSMEMLTRAEVFKIGLLFTLLLFNIIFLAVSIIERRLGYWIDEFTTIVDHILEILRLNKGTVKKSRSPITRPPAKKKKRR